MIIGSDRRCVLPCTRAWVCPASSRAYFLFCAGGGFGNDTAVEADLGGKQSTWDLLIHTELRG